MTDAPERIWACTADIGGGIYPPEELPKDAGYTHVSTHPDGDATEYIRADIAEARERAALAAVVQKLLSNAPHEGGDGPEYDLGYAAGYHTAVDRVRVFADTDGLAEYVEARLKAVINEAVGMADGKDEAAYVERRLRAAIREDK
jgi:hypothetical protein